MRQYKCIYCKEYEIEDNLVKEIKMYTRKKDHPKGNWRKGDSYNTNIRYHQSCYDQVQKEKLEWDDLYQYIQEIHDMDMIPPSFNGLLQRLRNGEPIIGKRKTDVKKFKQGFPYPVILETYKKVKHIIDWKKPSFKGSKGDFLQYVLIYYISNEIQDVYDQYKRNKQHEQSLNKEIDQNINYEVDTQTYTKQSDELDISKFL